MTSRYEVEINFLADGSDFLRSQLRAMRYSASETESPEQISLKYFNLLKRLIPSYPRQVLVSNKFSCPVELEMGLEIIKKKIRNGEDLRPHLSRRIQNLDYNDPLLNDWGIHHLHLGTTLDASGFITRTGPVLFARFDNERAFLINVMEHANWSKQEFIRILHENWPDSIRSFRLDRIWKLTYVPSDTDIKDLRQAKIQTFVQLEEGIVYAPLGGGYDRSGRSSDARIQSNCWMKTLENWEKWVRDNYLLLVEQAKHEGVTFGSKLKFRLMINDPKVYALEEASLVAWEICNSWFPMPWLSGYSPSYH